MLPQEVVLNEFCNFSIRFTESYNGFDKSTFLMSLNFYEVIRIIYPMKHSFIRIFFRFQHTDYFISDYRHWNINQW
jgi:hypothetical protein